MNGTKRWYFPGLLILCLLVLAVFSRYAVSVLAAGVEEAETEETETETSEEEEQEEEEGPWDPFEEILFQKEDLSVKGGSIKTRFSENGLLLSDVKQAVEGATIVFSEVFDFGAEEDAPVGRIMADGLVKAGTHMEVQLYLDDEKKPFAALQLHPMRAEEDWETVSPVFVELGTKISGEHELKVKVKDLTTPTGKKTSVLLRRLRFYRETLPVVSIDIDESLGTIEAMNSDKAHDTMCYGSMTVKVPEGFVSEYEAEEEEENIYQGGTYQMEYIRGRGESTWEVSKKPYKIKLQGKEDLFGMGASKHWALIANYYDLSFVRNRLTYWLGETLDMPFTPRLVPVEVVLNGKYLGLYYLSENIRLESSRVDLDDLEDYDGEDPDISGGYLLSLRRNYWEEEGFKFRTDHGEKILVNAPESAEKAEDPEKAIYEMNAYIMDYLNEMEAALFSPDFENEDGVPYTDYMDLESAAKYALIQAVCNNTDAYTTSSTYFYKEKGGKLYWGPLWDFDFVAWGSNLSDSYTLDEKDAARSASDFFVPGNSWINRMKNDPAFVQAIKDFWGGADSEDPETLAYQLNELVRDGGILDQYEEELAAAASNDADIPGNANDVFSESEAEMPEFFGDFHGEIFRLKRWIRDRILWVDENLDSFFEENNPLIELHFYEDGQLLETRNVTTGDAVNGLPVPKERADSYFAGWYGEASVYDAETGSMKTVMQQYSSNCHFGKDTDLTARFIRKDDPALPKALYIAQEEVWLPQGISYDLGVTLYPAGCDQSLFYSSSDLQLAGVSDNGQVATYAGAGDVTITVRTSNGLKKECLVHLLPNTTRAMPTSLSVSETEITLSPGEYRKLTFTGNPEGSTIIGFEILNGNRDVAFLDDSLTVNAVHPGTCEIYVLVNWTSVHQKITVHVTGEDPKPEPEKQPDEEKKDEEPKPDEEKKDEEPKPDEEKKDEEKKDEDPKPTDPTDPEDPEEPEKEAWNGFERYAFAEEDAPLTPEGQTGTLELGRVTFDDRKAGFLCLLGKLSGEGSAALSFFLDEETEPFAVLTLKGNGTTDGSAGSVPQNAAAELMEKQPEGTHELRMEYEINGGNADTALSLDSLFFGEGSLPVLRIDIDESQGTIEAMNGDTAHETKCYGSMSLLIPAGYTEEYGGKTYEEASTETYTLDYIRGRGNSTWGRSKKPYKIKLQEKADLFGMGKEKNWALLANFYDCTMLRNKLTYGLAAEFMPEGTFVPESTFVNVIMNGHYLGTYCLSEQIGIGKERLNIDDLEKEEGPLDEETVTGGYLLNMEVLESEGRVVKTVRNSFPVDSPEAEAMTDEALLYITSYLNTLEDAIYAAAPDSAMAAGETYLDIDSYIDYFLIQELSANGDAYTTDSTHLYKVRNGKLYFGPLWDFDYVAWGASNFDTEGFRNVDTCPWLVPLLKDAAFRERLLKRWEVLKALLAEAAQEDGLIDRYAESIRYAQKANYYVCSTEMWDSPEMIAQNMDSKNAPLFPEEPVTFESEVKRLKEWIMKRTAWMDQSISNICPDQVYLEYRTEDTLLLYQKADHGDSPLQFAPEVPVKEGFRFTGWYRTDASGNQVPMAETDTQDTSIDTIIYYAAYEANETEAELTEFGFSKEVYEVGVFSYMVLSDLLVTSPEDYDRSAVTFTMTADPEDCVYMDEGVMTCTKVGEVHLTAALGGREAECIIRIVEEEAPEEP